MCGRYASAKDPATLAAEFDAVDAMGESAPDLDYNVAPTKSVVAVVQRHPRDPDGAVDRSRTERTLRVMKWGLVPAWAKDASGGAKMINARSETAAEKPAFRKSLAERRCILPADGWFEWRRDKTAKTAKQPFYTTPRDGSSLAMAGLWTTWRDKADPDSPVLITCAVLTTDAVGPLADVHDRMPLLLGRDSWAGWLDPDATDVADLLAPPSWDLVDGLEIRPVAQMVNSVRNNGPELLAPLDPTALPDLDRPADQPADAPDLFSGRA
ncbi:SOS response-associated peptidase [Actinokineospora diospyrosa]|uniref:Abasic site processing protein n=1 Tax=Actinokineospora diospyrosa TaxID=103728 RepID=A0ABT1I7G5_9PSEU|nr:SOS response-associated peptidase [Actinokineospora diospyrosa]MCP2268575.1 putative SOS response-associated peptidase YedK [Actinokineospora diospyrosa]